MSLVLRVAVVVCVNYANTVHQHEVFLECRTRTDVDEQHLIALHIRLDPRRHKRTFSRRDHNLLCRCEVIPCACPCLALRQMNPRVLVN